MVIDKSKIKYAIFSLTTGLLMGIFGQPYIQDNQDAISIIVTVFSILSGFLVAITVIMGDPTSMLPGSWRIAEQYRSYVFNKLTRLKWLFKFYLITLGLIFISVLIKDEFPIFKEYLEVTFLTFSTTLFLFSLKLPSFLMEMQLERVEMVISSRRKKSGIKD